jgi:hypothetical protein
MAGQIRRDWVAREHFIRSFATESTPKELTARAVTLKSSAFPLASGYRGAPMASLVSRSSRVPVRVASPFRGLALLAAAVVSLAAALVGAALAVFFAATLLVIAVLAMALIALTVAAAKVRGSARRRSLPGLLEAQRIGGHSWVAYAWDRDL